MAFSQEYLDYVLEQLEPLGAVRAKKMFGGIGLYYDGDVFFALIENDVLRFKVDDSNRGDYTALGMGPFKPYKDKSTLMQYYEVPVDVLEEAETLAAWGRKAVAVALRARR